MIKLGKIMIVDGSYMMHRALHVESIFNLTNSQGIRTGGIFQFLRSLNSELNKHPDYYPLVTWDAGLSKRRLDVYPNYKHNLDKIADLNEAMSVGIEPNEDDEYLKEYSRQRAELIELLHILGIPSFKADGYEGDDLMYILSKLTDDGIVLTDDKDLIQLLSQSIKISRPLAEEFLVHDQWQATHNDPGMRKFVIAKAIVGDPSDNIPKCADGVGGVTAGKFAEIMVEKPTCWLDEIKASTKKAYQSFVTPESLKQFTINMELIDLSRVAITEDIQKYIAFELVNNLRVPNYFAFISALGKFEITSLDADALVSNLSSMVNRGGVLCQM